MLGSESRSGPFLEAVSDEKPESIKSPYQGNTTPGHF